MYLHGVVVNVLNCEIVSEPELKSRSYDHLQTNTLGKSLNPLILRAMGNILRLFSFYNDGFSFKTFTKVDVPLIKKPNDSHKWCVFSHNEFYHTSQFELEMKQQPVLRKRRQVKNKLKEWWTPFRVYHPSITAVRSTRMSHVIPSVIFKSKTIFSTSLPETINRLPATSLSLAALNSFSDIPGGL